MPVGSRDRGEELRREFGDMRRRRGAQVCRHIDERRLFRGLLELTLGEPACELETRFGRVGVK
ncbi:MAG: hypothetical protein QM760_10240 [Nibricoccus sp.]